MTDILAANSEDEHGPFWDPWCALGVSSAGYNSLVDDDAITVLRGIQSKMSADAIAKASGLAASHVELFQYLFCSAGWCDYGTSPRGCWFEYGNGEDFGARLIAAWETYYQRTWGEPADA